MLEVNAPQLPGLRPPRPRRLPAGGHDRLSAIEFLNQRQGPAERTINNCSSVYAVDPARFRCVRYIGMSRSNLDEVITDVIAKANPDYLVLPTGEVGDAVRALVPDEWFGPPIFEDGSYRVLPRADR